MQQKRFAQENHGEGLAGAGRVPDNAALAASTRLLLVDLLNQRLDAKDLLVTRGNLSDLLVEKDEKAHEFKQALLAEQADEHPVLICRQLRSSPEAFKVFANSRRAVSEEPILLGSRKGCILDRRKMSFIQKLLAPTSPEFLRCSGCRVLPGRSADRHKQLRICEQLRNLIGLLIADALADTFFNHRAIWIARLRTLCFNHNKRQSVNVADNVRTACIDATGTQDLQLFRDNEAVLLRLVPIDDRNRRRVPLPIDELSDGDTQGQCAVELLIGDKQPILHHRGGQLTHNLCNGIVRERPHLSLVFIRART
ncbi:hypothetical protein ACVIU7_007934 [Bradyrhizobium liaoningense]